MRRGVWYAATAYVAWGLFPLYWKALHGVPAVQLVGHRLVWSAVLLFAGIALTRNWKTFRTEAFKPRVIGIYTAAAILVSVNWLTYVWAVNAGFVVETSLGYFINPLISVVFGVVLLKEKLRPFQWAAVGLAALGVVYLTVVYGSLPWIALVLAVTFALYGLVKKLAPLGSANGLALETGLLFVPAVAYLVYAQLAGTGAFLHSGARIDLLLVGAGIATTVPLLLFASAARRIPLLWIGLLQYIAPTIQFLLGVLVYHEALTPHRLVGFCIVWAALAVFAAEGIITHRMTAFPATTD
jgi:chloramphenicol-sensitive protein RarD